MWRVDFPVVNEADRFFFKFISIGTFPVEIVDLLRRADEILRVAVTVQAERHAERLGVLDHVHLIHPSVAFHTTDTTIHVDCMIEINVIRCLMNTHPWDRFPRLVAIPDRGQHRIILTDHTVAGHTNLSGGHV